MKVLIADSAALHVGGIATIFKYNGSGVQLTTVPSYEQLIQAVNEQGSYDIIIIDLAVLGRDCVDRISSIKEISPLSNIAIISNGLKHEQISEIGLIGGISLIDKSISDEQFIELVKFIAKGGHYITTKLYCYGRCINYEDKSEPHNQTTLTRRETEVLHQLGEGLSNKIIAANLGVEEVTVRLHLRGIFRKVNAKNRVQAVLNAISMGLLVVPEADLVSTPPSPLEFLNTIASA